MRPRLTCRATTWFRPSIPDAGEAVRLLTLLFTLLMSGCRESNPVYMHPMHAYYRYTTARCQYSCALVPLMIRYLMIYTKFSTPAFSPIGEFTGVIHAGALLQHALVILG